MSVEIDEGIARRVLEVVDTGLVAGLGEPIPGQMCVEAAVCYALGLPHGDDPPCVSPVVRRLTIRLNDSRWSSPQARARGLRRLAVAALGSRDVLDEIEFVRRVARLAIQTCVPMALRAVAQHHAGAQRERLLRAADLCERKPTRNNALEARSAAYACTSAYAYAAYAAAHAAYAAAYADAAYAAAYADAAGAARAAADAVAYAAAADDDDAYADAYASVNAVLNTAEALAAYNDALAAFAERVVQILKDLDAPGCAFLHLTEVA